MDGINTKTIAPGVILDPAPVPPKRPEQMNRGEFEAWEKLRGRGQYDVVRDEMRFRTRRGVYSVPMPVRFSVEQHGGVVYAMLADIERDGKLQ